MPNRQKGATTALVALMLPILVAGMGLAIDGGFAYELKRRLQKAADSAAIAAAQELRRGNVGTYTAAALTDAKRNGFDAGNAVFDIYNPPTTGPRKGDASFVQVRVRSDSPAYFMKLFTNPEVPVEAMAVAGVIPGDKCIYTLDPHANKALWVGGSADINLAKCGIVVNSDDDKAAQTGSSATVVAASIDIVGDYHGPGFFPTPTTGALPADDPLADMPAPAFTACAPGGHGVTVKTVATLNPGVYCGGLTIQSHAIVTLNPGTYVMYGGGFNVHGHAVVTGVGVTFYVTEGPGYKYDAVDLMADSVVTLSAPTTGTYSGILFYQDRNVGESPKKNNFSGKLSATLTGAMYFPTTEVKMTGSVGALAQKVFIVAKTLELHGKVNLSAPDVGINSPYLMRASLVY